MAKVKTTEKGTELPLMNLRGKDYLEVKYRLVWFREVHPNGSIQTEVKEDGDVATARATIAVPIEGNYIVLATGHKRETKDNFPDNYEKAETGAIGRALAAAGFGTQFEPEFDEGERIVDAPVETKKSRSVPASGQGAASGKGSKEAPKAGTQNSKPAQENGPKQVARANGELRVVKAGETQPTKEGNAEGDYTRKLIVSEADVVINVKKAKTAAELKALLQEKYGVTASKDLNDEQAKEFLGYLKEISA